MRVPVRDRESDDGDETMTLNSATAARVADGAATGTIRASEPTTTPEIDDIDVVSTPRLSSSGGAKDTYGEGDPVMMLEVCDPGESLCEAEAHYESGSGTDTLVFACPVFEWDRDRNGIAIPADPIDVSIYDLDGFSIRNAAGQEADLSHRREGTQSSHKVNGHRQAGQHLWVEDAEAHEADGEMAFTVRLETRGTLRFNSLERERTVTVTVADDAHEDDGETAIMQLGHLGSCLTRSETGRYAFRTICRLVFEMATQYRRPRWAVTS